MCIRDSFISPEHGICNIKIVVSNMFDNPETVFDRTNKITEKMFTVKFAPPNQKVNEFRMPKRNLDKFKFLSEELKLSLPPLKFKETEHFIFYYFPGTQAEKDINVIAEEREKILNKIARMVNINFKGKIFVFFYPDAKSKRKITKHQGMGLSYSNTIVEIYNLRAKMDPNHEITHSVTALLGDPPALFDEGFATYNQKDHKFGNSHIDVIARKYKMKNMLWKIEDIFSFTDIGSPETKALIAYPEAASMVKYIIENYGMDKFLKLFKTLKRSDKPEQIEINKKEFKNITGRDIFTFEKEWRNYLDKIKIK